MTDLNIPEEAYDKADEVVRRYVDNHDAYDIGSDVLNEVSSLVVAAELERLVDETDWAWAVGSSLKARASELRGKALGIKEDT